MAPVRAWQSGNVVALPAATRQARGQPGFRIDPLADPPDAALIALVGAGACLRAGVLPWRRAGDAVLVLAPDATALATHAALLAPLGRLRFCPLDAAALRAALLQAAGGLLVAEAETRVAEAESCRGMARHRGRLPLALAAVTALVLTATPLVAASVALVWAALTLIASTGLRLAATLASRVRHTPVAGRGDPAPVQLPVVTLMLPLFHETEIAATLLERLGRLDYPAERLDLCLILEAEDDLTRGALARASLPAHAQVIEVPAGSIRTKPRALNYALNFARGTIIGIYDAEDRPAPDQILRVVRQFARSDGRTACLQGALDYYNHGSNWLARCFTLEYAGWFRVILPGLARLGLVVPLGGTTLFLRRHVIEEVGGWDAHNVTEDADLGVRLARRGYRTGLIDTMTEEEANARAWPWVKQRTRWLKGYAMTWAVHSRDPRRLLADLGPWRVLGLQILLFGTLSQFLLAPLFWSFWLLPLGLPHPLAGLMPHWALVTLCVLFLVAEAVNWLVAGLGAHRAGKTGLALWIPLMQLYFPMATVAAWRAMWQALRQPFHWEKTQHGVFAEGPPESPDAAEAQGPP